MTKRSVLYFEKQKAPHQYRVKLLNKLREEKDPIRKRQLLIIVTRHGNKYNL